MRHGIGLGFYPAGGVGPENLLMRALVTGGGGLIGSHLVDRLLSDGHDVRVLDNFATGRRENLLHVADDVEIVEGDIQSYERAHTAVRGCDVLFHAAGMVASTPVERVWEINGLAPRFAVEAAAKEDVGRVVVTSTVAGIGPVEHAGEGGEDDLYRGGGLGLTYPDSKHEGEVEALRAGARLGIDTVVTNPSYVLGVPIDRTQPGETSTRIVGNYLRGRLPVVLDAPINFVDVEDVATGHLLAAEKGEPG